MTFTTYHLLVRRIRLHFLPVVTIYANNTFIINRQPSF